MSTVLGIAAVAALFAVMAVARPDDRRGTGCHGCSMRKNTRFECGSCPVTEGTPRPDEEERTRS